MEGNPEPGECQVCTKIYETGQDLETGFFRLEWNKFAELDSVSFISYLQPVLTTNRLEQSVVLEEPAGKFFHRNT